MIFFKRHYITIVLGLVLALMVVFSFSTLLTRPKLWSDEAMSIELARNFLHQQVLNIQIAPGVFYDFPYLVQPTGYPVTVPLAGVFKFFGQGLFQARLYMLIWMIGMVIMVFVTARRLFGKKQALAAVALIITLASFYGSGRTVVGEIPGFTFLLFGLYLLVKQRSHLGLGVFWGLAIVSKPSVFAMLVPAVCLVLLLESGNLINKFRHIWMVAVGMLPAGILSIFFMISHPFSREPWVGIMHFFQNPYSSSSIPSNMAHNLSATIGSTTFLYFGFLFAVVVVARFLSQPQKVPGGLLRRSNFGYEGWINPCDESTLSGGWIPPHEIQNRKGQRLLSRGAPQEQKNLLFIYNFVLVYSILAFVYYLRSPGWIRYILIAELLILFILPNAIGVIISRLKQYSLVNRFREELLLYGVVALFVFIQTVQLFTGAQLYKSSSALQTAKFVNEQFPGASVANFYSLEVSVLLQTEQRFNVADFVGMPLIGSDPLPSGELPAVIVVNLDYQSIAQTVASIEKRYQPLRQIGQYIVYSKI